VTHLKPPISDNELLQRLSRLRRLIAEHRQMRRHLILCWLCQQFPHQLQKRYRRRLNRLCLRHHRRQYRLLFQHRHLR
jgi:hypothetical protein